MLKYVRVAVTVLSLTACVLLVALWVRSYWWSDFVRGRIAIHSDFSIQSARGGLALFASVPDGIPNHSDSAVRISCVPTNRLAPMLPEGRSILGFRREPRINATTAIVIPLWFPVLLSAAAATVFYFKQSLRFSLCSLLVATTLVAVALGLIAAAT